MSRSYRQTPITGITMACSEKWDKRHANRKLRHKVKAGALDLRLREVSNVWSFEKDGKAYWQKPPVENNRNPQLISPEQFRSVQKRLKENHHKAARNMRVYFYSRAYQSRANYFCRSKK